MTTMTVAVIERRFKYSGIALPDLDPTASLEQIKAMYAPAYPELNNAVIEGPVEADNVLTYEFRRAVGTKGLH